MSNIIEKLKREPLNFIILYLLLVGVIEATFIPINNRAGDIILSLLLTLPIISFFLFKGGSNIGNLIKEFLDRPNLIIVLYLLWGLVGVAFSISREISFYYVVGGSIIFLSGFAITKELIRKIWLKRFLYTISLVGLLASLYAAFFLIVQFFRPEAVSTFAIVDVKFGKELLINNLPILTSYFERPNSLGVLLFYSIVASLSLLFLEERRLRRSYLYLASIILLITLTFTLTRASILAASIFSGLVFFPALFKRLYFIPAVLIFLAFIFLGTSLVSFQVEYGVQKPLAWDLPNVYEKIRYVPKQSLTGRESLWESSINYIKKNPVFGAGFGNSSKAIEANISTSVSRLKGLTPHSTYLRTGVESGIVGLGLYLLLIFSYFKLFIENLKRLAITNWVIFSVIVAALVLQIFETTFLLGTGFKSFYFLLLLAAGFGLVKR